MVHFFHTLILVIFAFLLGVAMRLHFENFKWAKKRDGGLTATYVSLIITEAVVLIMARF
jgi:hypothetical protein